MWSYRIIALPSLVCAILCIWLMIEFLIVSKLKKTEDFWFGLLLLTVGWRLFFASLAINSTDPTFTLLMERTGYISFIIFIPLLPILVHSVIKENNRIILLFFVACGLSLLPFVYSEDFISSDIVIYTAFGLANTEHYSGTSQLIHKMFSLFIFISAIYCQIILIRYVVRNPRVKYTIYITVGLFIATLTGLFDLASMIIPLSTPPFFEYGVFTLVSLTTYALNMRIRTEKASAFEECRIAKEELEVYAEKLEEKVRVRTQEFQDERDKVINAQNILSKYISPQLTEKVLSGQVELVWEHHRRRLALFFSDIKDFTRITDGMEPEELGSLLNEYLSTMTNIIEKYGGTLANISGDGLFVFIGAPDSTDDKDHAMRCVRMAIEMQRIIGDLNQKWFNDGIEEPLQIRCGINSGVATVGGYGSQNRREYTALGMHVNLASRLENVCEPGRILVSHSIWALTKDTFSFQEKGQVEIKGLHRPVRAYYVDF